MQKTLFITWIEHRRTRHLCERLDLPLVELISRKRGIRRYLELAARTISTLVRQRPEVLLVQSPSIVLALLALTLRPFFRYKLIVDAHNEAVEPYLHPTWTILRITRLLLRRADLTLVTNQYLARKVVEHGGEALILPDSIPAPPITKSLELRGEFSLVLISTFAGDEPFSIVVQAMQKMDSGTHLYVTGNPQKLPKEVRDSLPANMTLTGFLSEEDYWSMLASSDAVMDLTTMDHCLVCGAYEAVALERPLLLSANDASVDLFSDFAVFTDNTTDNLVNSINKLKELHRQIHAAMPESRRRFEESWEAHAKKLRSFMRRGANQLPA